MSEPTYRQLRHAVRMGRSVQFQLPAQKHWTVWDSDMVEPSLGYALCKWRIYPNTDAATAREGK